MRGSIGRVETGGAPVTAKAGSTSGADWAHVQERGNAFGFRAMSWIARVCGRRAARLLLHPITLYFMLFVAPPRRHAKRFLGRALGRAPGWRELYRHLFSFAATVLDRVYLLRGELGLFDIRVERGALVDAALADGRGALLFGAHMGSFEAVRAIGADRAGLSIAMVMYPDNAHLISAALAAIAPGEFRPHIIALGRADSTLAMRDWLEGGGLVGVLADRMPPVGSQRADALQLPFLGREASFSDGPFRLAMLLRRPVIFMAALYRGRNRYDVRFETLADFSVPIESAAQRELELRDAVQAYVARLELLCRECPYNWFNFYDFWREDPA